MVSKFYSEVIKEEIKKFDISSAELKEAAKSIFLYHNKTLQKKNSTYVDYTWAKYRCAYMYLYAPLYSKIVAKYFLKLLKKKEVKSSVFSKKDLKICCLGSGCGIAVVGIFKALSYLPFFQQRISQISVLDTEKEWLNSFENVMHSLLQEKLKNVPTTIVKEKKFNKQLLEIYLEDPLSEDIIKIISNADIITMVHFFSVASPHKESLLKALQEIGHLFKQGAIFLCIENFDEDVVNTIESFSTKIGLDLLMNLGPEIVKQFFPPQKEVFGRNPVYSNTVSVGAWIKTRSSSLKNYKTALTSVWDDMSRSRHSSCDSECLKSSSCSESNWNSNSFSTDEDIDSSALSDRFNADFDSMNITSGFNTLLHEEHLKEAKDLLDLDSIAEGYSVPAKDETASFNDSSNRETDTDAYFFTTGKRTESSLVNKNTMEAGLINKSTQTEANVMTVGLEEKEIQNSEFNEIIELTQTLIDLLDVVYRFKTMKQK